MVEQEELVQDAAPDELEEAYLQYFTPPVEPDTGAYFDQVSVFDYSTYSYTSNSTEEQGATIRA